MHPYRKSAAAAVVLALAPLVAASQPASGDALTVYSTAQPGAVRPELYRDGARG